MTRAGTSTEMGLEQKASGPDALPRSEAGSGAEAIDSADEASGRADLGSGETLGAGDLPL